MFASEFNRLYYNPDITYEPPVDGSGNQANAAFPNGACGPNFTSSCATTYKMMNSANTFGVGWKRVPNDMYLLPPACPRRRGEHDRSHREGQHPVFCNTDWPKKAFPDDPAGTRSGRRSATPTARTIRPRYPTRGSDCRINGNYYAG